MYHLRVPGLLFLLVGLCLVFMAQTHSVTTQQVAQRVASNDVEADEATLSLLINQIAVLKLLNETSNTCSSQQTQLQEIFEFGVKAEQLKGELRIIKETALDEIEIRKAEVLNETRLSIEEVARTLQDIKSEILTELRQQDERRRQEMVEFGVKAEQLKDEINIIKETALGEIQERKAEVLNETRLEARQSLQDIKSEILTELRQQGESAIVEKKRKTYRKYNFGVTHPQAIKACEELGGRLALPTNNEENELIWREIGGPYDPTWSWTKYYWISGTDQYEEGNWVDGITREPLRYTNFAEGEPNNGDGNEDCIFMYNSPKWYDYKCHRIGLGYVCEFLN